MRNFIKNLSHSEIPVLSNLSTLELIRYATNRSPKTPLEKALLERLIETTDQLEYEKTIYSAHTE